MRARESLPDWLHGRLFILLIGVLLAAVPLAASVHAQVPPTIPTIIQFESTVVTVRLPELESNGVNTVLSWSVANMTPDQRLTMEFYRGSTWESIPAGDATNGAIPASGSLSLRLAHPRSFAPPTFRLRLMQGDQVIDERMLVIPYEVPPSMARFTASATPGVTLEGVPRILFFDRDEASNGERIVVTWQIDGRAPGSNPQIDQVLADGSTINVEPPRDQLWLPSIGALMITTVPDTNGEPIRLRMRVVDQVTQLVYDEALLTLDANGEIPAAAPTETPLPITGIPPTVFVVPSGSLNLSTLTPGAEANSPTLPAPPTIAGQPEASPTPSIPPRILDFHAEPTTVTVGGYTRLTWSVTDAVVIEIQEIDASPGASGQAGLLYIQLPAQGNLQIQLPPGVSLMRYVLTARNAAGAIAEAEVLVGVG